MSRVNEIGLPSFSRPRRVDEEARLARTQDVKYRCIGVDKAALDAQVLEKNQIAVDELNRDKRYQEMGQILDDRLVLFDKERDTIKREIDKECADFWKEKQTREQNLEWDLNKPESQKHAIPTRTGDHDPRLGPSSCQKFVGEDLQAGDRKKLQMTQQATWCEQQLAEKRDRLEEEKDEDKNYDALMNAQAEHQKRVDMCERNSRRTLQRQIYVDNRAKAAENEENRKQDLIDETLANEVEQFNTFNSALLSEHPSQAINHCAPDTRKRADHYKGMLPSQKQDVLDFQSKQREELKGKKLEEQLARKAHADYNDELAALLNNKQSEVWNLFISNKKTSVIAEFF